jgi:hypothetical protein
MKNSKSAKEVEVNGKKYVAGSAAYKELYNDGNGMTKSAIAKILTSFRRPFMRLSTRRMLFVVQ